METTVTSTKKIGIIHSSRSFAAVAGNDFVINLQWLNRHGRTWRQEEGYFRKKERRREKGNVETVELLENTSAARISRFGAKDS
jgi:hypothetical protein